MDDRRIDGTLAAMLAPPARRVDDAFVRQTERLIALDVHAAAARRAGVRRVGLGVIGAFAAAGGLSLFADTRAVSALGSGIALPAALALLLLTLVAQLPALGTR